MTTSASSWKIHEPYCEQLEIHEPYVEEPWADGSNADEDPFNTRKL